MQGLTKLGIEALQFDYPSGFSKAYANRICLAFCAELLRATETPQLKVQAVLAWSITAFGCVCDRADVFFNDSERLQAAQLGLTYVQTHVWLAREALLQVRPRYKVRPRLHSFLCENVCKLLNGSALNPKYTATWADESFIGKSCGVAKQPAVHPSTVAKRLLQRLELNLNAYIAKQSRQKSQDRLSAELEGTFSTTPLQFGIARDPFPAEIA